MVADGISLAHNRGKFEHLTIHGVIILVVLRNLLLFFNTEGFVIMEKVLASCLEAATRENGKYSVLATGRLNLSIRVWKHIQKWFILRCDYGVIRNH